MWYLRGTDHERERERLGWKDLGRDEKNSYFDYHKESFEKRDLGRGLKNTWGVPVWLLLDKSFTGLNDTQDVGVLMLRQSYRVHCNNWMRIIESSSSIKHWLSYITLIMPCVVVTSNYYKIPFPVIVYKV